MDTYSTHNRDTYLRWAVWLSMLVTSVVSVCWRYFLPAGEHSDFFEDTTAKYVVAVLVLFLAALAPFNFIDVLRKAMKKLHLLNPWGVLAVSFSLFCLFSLTQHLPVHLTGRLYSNGALLFILLLFLVTGKLDFEKSWFTPLLLLPLLGEFFSVVVLKTGYAFGIYIILLEVAYLFTSVSMTHSRLSKANKWKILIALGFPSLTALFCFVFFNQAAAAKLTVEWLQGGMAAFPNKYGGTFMFVCLVSLHVACGFFLSYAARKSEQNTFLVRLTMLADATFILLGILAWYGVVPAPSIHPMPFRSFSTARICLFLANALCYRQPKPSAFFRELWKLVAEEEEKKRLKKERKKQKLEKEQKANE